MRVPGIFTSFTTDNSGVSNGTTSQISMLAGVCIQHCHRYKARLGPINGLIVPTLDVDG